VESVVSLIEALVSPFASEKLLRGHRDFRQRGQIVELRVAYIHEDAFDGPGERERRLVAIRYR
jgi:hypothetical protein